MQSTALLVDPVPEVPFYIPATGPSTRPRRTLKHGDSFAVFDSHGDIGATTGGPDGVFHADTRFLSRLELLLNGMQLLLLGSNVRDDNSVLTVDLTNPDIYFEQHLVLPKDTLHLVRTLFLWRSAAYQRVKVENHGDRAVHIRLSFTFASDFADLFEVRGIRRERRGVATTQLCADGQDAILSYQGLDGRLRRTTLGFDPPPSELATGVASYALDLKPHERRSIFVATECDGANESRTMPYFRAMLRARRELKVATRATATVETSNEILNEVLCRSMADLYMLTTDTPEGPYPYAGIPWYSTTFGRDGVITALQFLWCDPGIARGVLAQARRLSGEGRRSARRCGAGQDPARDALRRNGRAARGAVRALLRQRRFHAAVRAAGRPLCRAHRRPARRCASCGRMSRRRSAGSTGRAIPMATASSNITA